MSITFAGVCSGIRGLEVAMRNAGMRHLWSCEIDKNCNAVAKLHFPEETVYTDMLKIPLDTCAKPDVLVGGTPCQDFSISGMRNGLKGARGNLTMAFCIIADTLNPRWIVWENVPGTLSLDDNAFGTFLGELVGAGQPLPGIKDGKWPGSGMVVGPRRVVGWRLLDAQYFGLAQRRKRIVLVGHSRNLGRLVGETPEGEAGRLCRLLSEVLFESPSVRRNSPPSRKKGQTASALTSAGVGTCGADDNQAQANHLVAAPLTKDPYADRAAEESNLICEEVAATLKGGSGARGWTCDDGAPLVATIAGDVAHSLQAEGHDASEDGTGRGTPIIAHAICSKDRRLDPTTETLVTLTCGDRGVSPDQACANMVIPFDTTQLTNKENRSNPGPNDPCHPLQAEGHAPAVAYNVQSEHSNAMSGNGSADVANEADVARSLDTTGGFSHNQGGTAVSQTPFSIMPMNSNTDFKARETDIAQPLMTAPVGGAQGGDVITVIPIDSQATRQGEAKRESKDANGKHRKRNPALGVGNEGDPSPTLQATDVHAVAVASGNMVVRRLTPTECARLQGFSDTWNTHGIFETKKGPALKPIADGPRYKQFGNAVAVPVFAWIARRIVSAEAAMQEPQEVPA